MSGDIPKDSVDPKHPSIALPKSMAVPVGETASASDSFGSSVSGPRWLLGRLTKIEIQNYRGVRGRLELEASQGENLLLYGENGSGKSSIFHAIRDFLESVERDHFDDTNGKRRRLVPSDFMHRFTKEKPRVVLHFGTEEMAWSESERGPERREARDLDKGKGFLDYKALLEFHFLDRTALDIDLFPLVISHLLPHYPNSASAGRVTFQEQWRGFLRRTGGNSRRGKNAPEPISQTEVDEFNSGFEYSITALGERATSLLSRFGEETAVSLLYQPAALKPVRKDSPKSNLDPPRLLARPIFRRMALSDYDRVLNEARLSALAICLFFAALKESPSNSLRILALDDILIGLDMANRLTVLELIHELFADWQILFFTYSKAWFELLKERVKSTPSWTANWKYIVLREEWQGNDPSPCIVADDSGDLLQMAERHLKHKDYRAAAVYARSALEALCHYTCAKAHLPVVHVALSKHRKVEHYIEVLERRLGKLRDKVQRETANRMIARLKEARAFVLNSKSHFDAEEEDTLSGEIAAAIQVVRDLEQLFTSDLWKKTTNFEEGEVFSLPERLRLTLAEARKLATFDQHRRVAMKRMEEAHELAWTIYGRRCKVSLPIDKKPSSRAIWDAALAQTKLDTELNGRLQKAKPYLFGSARREQFKVFEFESAVQLLEELASPPSDAARQQKEKWLHLRRGMFGKILRRLDQVLIGYSQVHSRE
jgi:energy-coupling factor transporter ATP-binding protein EcfA2